MGCCIMWVTMFDSMASGVCSKIKAVMAKQTLLKFYILTSVTRLNMSSNITAIKTPQLRNRPVFSFCFEASTDSDVLYILSVYTVHIHRDEGAVQSDPLLIYLCWNVQVPSCLFLCERHVCTETAGVWSSCYVTVQQLNITDRCAEFAATLPN